MFFFPSFNVRREKMNLRHEVDERTRLALQSIKSARDTAERDGDTADARDTICSDLAEAIMRLTSLKTEIETDDSSSSVVPDVNPF